MDKTNKAVFDINTQCCDITNNLIKEETMEKIDITKILKDCPKAMELDCYLFNGLEFDHIDTDNENYPIVCRAKDSQGEYYTHTFTKYGWYTSHYDYAKCVIFPKGKTTWEGFVPPCKFKDGDIIISDRGDIHLLRTEDSSYCAYRERWQGASKLDKTITTGIKVKRFATEEEKQKLFQAIKDNGYKWNSETKTLEKLLKFKVGDRIKYIYFDRKFTKVVKIHDKGYELDNGKFLDFQDENAYEISYDKFNITILKPFVSRVLVRDKDNDEWRGQFFSHYYKNSDKPYICIGVEGLCEYKQCIPYEGNKHLLGTNNDCEEYFKTWKQ